MPGVSTLGAPLMMLGRVRVRVCVNAGMTLAAVKNMITTNAVMGFVTRKWKVDIVRGLFVSSILARVDFLVESECTFLFMAGLLLYG
jgi:hypothetical protein